MWLNKKVHRNTINNSTFELLVTGVLEKGIPQGFGNFPGQAT